MKSFGTKVQKVSQNITSYAGISFVNKNVKFCKNAKLHKYRRFLLAICN
jgi:hypothetical protein